MGLMRERITVESPGWAAIVVTITRMGAVATITASAEHGWQSGDYVLIAGASPSAYNGVKAVTVTGDMAATFAVDSGASTPATGTITAQFQKDGQGGVRPSWIEFARMPAAEMPISADERMRMGSAVPAMLTARLTRFKVRAIAGLNEQQRVRRTPVWPPGSPEEVFQITGVLPFEDGRRFKLLECVAS